MRSPALSMRSSLGALAGLGVVITALAGCQATRTAELQPASQIAADQAGYGLYLTSDGANAKLAYGVANSDNVRLMLECEKGSGVVHLTDVASDRAPRLILTSNGKRSDLPVQVDGDSGMTPLLTGEAKWNEAAFTGFRDTGRLDVRFGRSAYGVAAKDNERAAVGQFFDFCRKG